MMVLKQGGTETSPTAIRTREVFFFTLVYYEKEKNGSAHQAADGTDSGASAHE